MKKKLNCLTCRTEFFSRKRDAKYCSSLCYNSVRQREKLRKLNRPVICEICKKTETYKCRRSEKVIRLSQDHNHVTGKLRGFLCAHCNHALGEFKDNIEVLQEAITYLNKYL